MYARLLQYVADTTNKLNSSDLNIPKPNPNDVLWGVVNTAYYAAGVIAIIVIIVSGYSFATAVYDPAKVEKARNSILYAVVGLIIVVSAFVVTQFVMGSLK